MVNAGAIVISSLIKVNRWTWGNSKSLSLSKSVTQKMNYNLLTKWHTVLFCFIHFLQVYIFFYKFIHSIKVLYILYTFIHFVQVYSNYTSFIHFKQVYTVFTRFCVSL